MMNVMNRNMIRGPKTIIVAITTFFMMVSAHSGSDHDQARSALLRGEIMPLKQLLERLETTHPGQILEVELEREGNRWRYEVKILQTEGKLLKLDVDAVSGEVLRQRDRPTKKNH